MSCHRRLALETGAPSLWAGDAAATLLFGLQPHDALWLAAVDALLATVALFASYVSARRAPAGHLPRCRLPLSGWL